MGAGASRISASLMATEPRFGGSFFVRFALWRTRSGSAYHPFGARGAPLGPANLWHDIISLTLAVVLAASIVMIG